MCKPINYNHCWRGHERPAAAFQHADTNMHLYNCMSRLLWLLTCHFRSDQTPCTLMPCNCSVNFEQTLVITATSYCPGGGETICPRRWQFDSRWIYVRPRTGPQSAHFWKCQRAYSLGSCATQPACYSHRLGLTDGHIAASPNAPPPYGGGITTSNQSNLRFSRIAAGHGPFNCIRQLASMGPLSNT